MDFEFFIWSSVISSGLTTLFLILKKTQKDMSNENMTMTLMLDHGNNVSATPNNRNTNRRSHSRIQNSLDVKYFVGETDDFDGVLSLWTKRFIKECLLRNFEII